MASGDELFAQLAERPFDRALRLVFADWLLERDDPRGEVIALGAREHLSLSERRRVQRLTEQHGAQWLGPLRAVADLPACKWKGGFLSTFVASTPPATAWAGLEGALALASVQAVTFPVTRSPPPVQVFLGHRVLRHVTRLQAGEELFAILGQAPVAFTCETVALASWGTFAHGLSTLRELELFKSARNLELVTSEFINPIIANEVCGQILGQPPMLRRLEEVRLVARFGVVEGAVAWLVRGAKATSMESELANTRRWAIDYGEVRFGLQRDREGRLAQLEIDLSIEEGQVGLGARVATASSVLVLLAPAQLSGVDVRLPEGAGLRPTERDALRSAVRRLGNVSAFSLGGAPVLP